MAVVILNKAYANRLMAERNPPKATPTIVVEPVPEGEAQPEGKPEPAPERAPVEIDYMEILGDMKIKMIVFDDLIRLASFHNLLPEERPKNIELSMEDLSSCLSPLKKLRRLKAKTLLAEKIEKLYSDAALSK